MHQMCWIAGRGQFRPRRSGSYGCRAAIRPEIPETAGALFSYRKYAGFRWIRHKSNRVYALGHYPLGTYFRDVSKRNLQQMAGQVSLMLQKQVGSEVTRK